MQKFYEVTSESNLWKDYLDYKENSNTINEIYKYFSEEHEIESTQYYPTTDNLYIVPTQNDEETFKNQLTKKDLGNGLRRIRVNSNINKSWITTLQRLDLKVLNKPYVPFYFNVYGRIRTMIFSIDDKVYCSIETENDFNTPHVGFKEIKASEFYKMIEE